MLNYRTILAGLIALAVALAPVASALAGGQTLGVPAMEDCHGQPPADHGCCDTQAKCPDACGVVCCKLIALIAPVAALDRPLVVPVQASDPQRPPDWQLRPRPPPPRT